ncbi:DUF2599 domain-containing protein [Gordonia sp. PP30]|uniref:DUF2599 domain-containing protein n=1 Tax=Gordonia sp. PP30 TaxID=2935861 RepID=UPI001FFF0F6F|nr:DUF2599 domain-containing protein [Gordonia sp. PP30]UQE74645.1 DUF2599 domain-containing protein [Gordonia sp. PP30]
MRTLSGRVVSGLLACGLLVGVPVVVGAPAAAVPRTQQQRDLAAEFDAYRAGNSGERGFAGLPWPATRPGPYVAAVTWVTLPTGPSLQIRPTAAGRRATGWGVPDAAWREVLALAPDGGGPGMRAQFDCHWVFARLVDPNKASWNLEPNRPVVGVAEMIATRCNPGFAEERLTNLSQP